MDQPSADITLAACQGGGAMAARSRFNKRRQGGKEERNSDLLINCDADNGGDVDLSARRQRHPGIFVQLETEDRI